MVASFRDLQRSRDKMFEELNKQVERDTAKGGGRPEADPRFWYPSTDQAGNGYAVIRFMPPAQGEIKPYVREFAHGFKGPGGWYINKSRTTLLGADGKPQPDPVSEYNREIWKEAEALKENGRKEEADVLFNQVKNRKRNVSYVANVYIIQDPQNPENVGKTFLYRYGPKIFDKIQDQMKPQFEGQPIVNVFDFWGGADFVMKITTNKPLPNQKKGFRNYDNSAFKDPSPFLDGDEKALEAVWNGLHKLEPLVAEDTFKSYAELKVEFDRAMKITETSKAPVGRSAPEREERTVTETKPSMAASEPEVDNSIPWDTSDDEPEDDLEVFRRMAQQAA